MEVKTAAWSTVALVIVAFGGTVIFAIEREGVKNDLSKARGELNSMRSTLDIRRKTLADRQEAYALLQDRLAAISDSTDRIKLQEGKNDQTQDTIETLRKDWTRTRAAFAKDIDQVRQNTKDELVSAMVLADGTELKAVRFKEMKDNTIVLEHAAGIAKLPLANMPKDWSGRLALGWNPKLSAEFSGKPDEVAPEAPAPAPVKTVEMAQQEHRESVTRAGVTDALAKIKMLERKIVDTQKARSAQISVAQEYERKYALAQYKGNSSNHGVKSDEAYRIAEGLANQVSAIQQQISRLQQEVAEKSH